MYTHVNVLHLGCLGPKVGNRRGVRLRADACLEHQVEVARRGQRSRVACKKRKRSHTNTRQEQQG